MEELFLPVLHSFENGNVFTGSLGLLRFKITPQITMKTPKEVDLAASSIRGEYWHGLCCYEKSQIEGEAVFPLSEQGRAQLRSWLEQQIQ